MMKQHSAGGGVVAVDTCKFESWPLLRPDELSSLPTEVLRASVADLEVMCRQASGSDPVTDYARRQHQRTSAILVERAAQVRVRALLAGTEFIGRNSLAAAGAANDETPERRQPAAEMAPTHDETWPNKQRHHCKDQTGCFTGLSGDRSGRLEEPDFVAAGESSIQERCSETATGAAPWSKDGGGKEGALVSRAVRSPPALLPRNNMGLDARTIFATADSHTATTAATAETGHKGARYPATLPKEANRVDICQGQSGGEQINKEATAADIDVCGTTVEAQRTDREQRAAAAESPSREREQHKYGSGAAACVSGIACCGQREQGVTHGHDDDDHDHTYVSYSDRTVRGSPAPATAPPDIDAAANRLLYDRRGWRAPPAPETCAVRDNWGSVFVVGGGRRRRRPPAKQRSAEMEETPAARRAQVEKERQERRKASLRRLMARKEQRALQQEARRKRRAAAARATAAARKASERAAAAAAAALAASTTTVTTHPAASSSAAPTTETSGVDAARVGGGGGEEATADGGESNSSRGCEKDKEVANRESGLVVEPPDPKDGHHRDQHQPIVDSSAGSERGDAYTTPPSVRHGALTTDITKEEGSEDIDGVVDAKMAKATPKVSGVAVGGSDGGGVSGGGSSTGSESESVSGGDSSDDDGDLFGDEIENEDGCEDAAECAESSSERGNMALPMEGRLPDGRKMGVVQQTSTVPWARKATEGIGPESGPGVNTSAGYQRNKEGLRVEYAAPEDAVGVELERESRLLEQEQQETSGAELPAPKDPPKTPFGDVSDALTVADAASTATTIVGGRPKAAAGSAATRRGSAIRDEAGIPAVAASDGSETELEWEDKTDGEEEAEGDDDSQGGGDGRWGGHALEMPGPLDVQPVAEIQVDQDLVGPGSIGRSMLAADAARSQKRVVSATATDSTLEESPGLFAPGPNTKRPFGSIDRRGSGLALSSTLSSPSRLPASGATAATAATAAPAAAAAAAAAASAAVADPRNRGDGARGGTAAFVGAINRAPTLPATTSVGGNPKNSPCSTEAPSANTKDKTDAAYNAAAWIKPGRNETGLHASVPGELVAPEDADKAPRPTDTGHDIEPVDRRERTRFLGNMNLSAESGPAENIDVSSSTECTTAAHPSPTPQQQTIAVNPQARNFGNSPSILPTPTPPAAASGDADDGSSVRSRGSKTGGAKPPRSVGRSTSATRYADCYPKFAAILSAYHNGRALTRPSDCRTLPLTSKIMARGRGGRGAARSGRNGDGSCLTAAEEESCLHWQWKLYAIHVRVIKDYAAVFSYGDGWTVNASTDDSNSLIYSGDSSALHYRVNSKARPEVYNIVTDVLNNRCEQWEELPTGLGLKTTWNLLWTWSKPHIQYSSLLTWQKVNHFPNSRELTRKDLLNKHISRFMAPGGRLAKEFHIMPQTFVLPHEFTLFVAAFTAAGSGHSQSSGGGAFDDIDRGITSSDDEDDGGTESGGRRYGRGRSGSRGKGARKKNLWIMKPVGMSRGRGIRLIDDIKNISYADKVVLQKYVGNPLLLDGYKFDLRLYVLVTSFNKLEAFIYKEGFARLSTHRYEKGDIDNRFIHLTNSSIQRLNEAGAARDSPLHHAKTSEAGGTKTTLSYLWRRLAASGVDVGALWAGICSVVVKSLVCVEGSIPNQPNSFELFGYDVLIDDRLRPWLIEVNSSPSMARDSHVDRQVKEALIFETVHLVDPLPFDRQKLVDVLGQRLSENQGSKARVRSFRQQQHQHQRQQQRHLQTSEEGRGAQDGINNNSNNPPACGDHQRRRRSKEEVDLDRDLDAILCGRRPRQVGEPPARMGNFVRLCPGTAAHRHARRLRRRVIRPQPGDEDEPAAK